MIDADLFKNINDTYGHSVGDRTLNKLADVCKETLREVDVVGRMGGEEFAVLLPETDSAKANDVAERLRQAIEESKVPLESGLPLKFTVSIGVASLTSEDDNIDVLLNHADVALYKAKRAGRNKVCADFS
jgi:diguanylate cyclase (GGDEF)-like protein